MRNELLTDGFGKPAKYLEENQLRVSLNITFQINPDGLKKCQKKKKAHRRRNIEVKKFILTWNRNRLSQY